MAKPMQARNRLEIRQAIGYNLADIIVGTATGGGDTASLLDTYGLAKGGDDEYNGRQVQFNTLAAGSPPEKTFVSDFADTGSDATLAPVLSGAVAANDTYEMWKTFLVEDINDAINQAIMEVTARCLQMKETHNNHTAKKTYEYAWLTSFKALHSVEYVSSVGEEVIIHRCNAVWDELVDGDVTASLDTALEKEGTGCLKLVVAAGCGAGDILATEDISSKDLSECDELEIWIYSSVALSAGDLQVLLDDTAQCASAVESLNIPATTAATWTRHVISLANPHLDTAIISVGLKMVTDKGAFTLYADDIKAVKATSRVYRELNPEYWSIVKGSTNYLRFTENGFSVVSSPTQIRLTGYQLAALLSDDTTDSEIDPAYLIAAVTGNLLISHAKSRSLDINDRQKLSQFWLAKAEKMKIGLTTDILPDTRWI